MRKTLVATQLKTYFFVPIQLDQAGQLLSRCGPHADRTAPLCCPERIRNHLHFYIAKLKIKNKQIEVIFFTKEILKRNLFHL